MSGCGCSNDLKFDGLSAAYKRVLWIVIAINAIMFAVEMGAGVLAGSQALKADALDFLGDTATYTITLLVIGMPLAWRARAALFRRLADKHRRASPAILVRRQITCHANQVGHVHIVTAGMHYALVG